MPVTAFWRKKLAPSTTPTNPYCNDDDVLACKCHANDLLVFPNEKLFGTVRLAENCSKPRVRGKCIKGQSCRSTSRQYLSKKRLFGLTKELSELMSAEKVRADTSPLSKAYLPTSIGFVEMYNS